MPRGVKNLKDLPKKIEVTDRGYLFWQYEGSKHIHIKELTGAKREYDVLVDNKILTKQNAGTFLPATGLVKEYHSDCNLQKGESS